MKNKISNEDYFNFFKLCLNKDNQISSGEINKLAEISNLNYTQTVDVIIMSNTIKQFHEIKRNNQEKYSDIFYHYKQILEKTTNLARELKLTTSLEFSMLYTYLLYSGYFSKDRNLLIQSEGRKFITGLYAVDIMAGKGVCLNFSDMLKDFLNDSGFNSAIISSCEVNKFLEKHDTKKRATHASNLIIENGKIYIYDSTNMRLLKLKKTDSASIIVNYNNNFKHKYIYNYKLYPYDSYYLNLTPKSASVLDILNTRNDFNYSYDKKTYIQIYDKSIDTFIEN